jgi:spermidine/putrescine transport system ATP-binding protein
MAKIKGQAIRMDHVSMRYPGSSRDAVKNIHVEIGAGEFFSFLGPSGCGKTTLLRLISGFLDPTQGRVLINRKDMRGIGPNKRPTAMIFQNLALFPLMSVADNIGFGLEVRGVPKRERFRRASRLLELVDLPEVENKRVDDLSGGQRQRVAIARGLAVEPAVLLLDEPLSALDLKLRQHMRTELRKIQRRTGVTFIYITHDQGEALTMSDRIGVLSDQGELLQVGRATSLYNEPDTAFVADFVGENNAIAAIIHKSNGDVAVSRTSVGLLKGRNPGGLMPGTKVLAFVRPEAIFFANPAMGAENNVTCRVENLSFEGAHVTLFLSCRKQRLVMRLNNDGKIRMPKKKEAVHVCFSMTNTRFLPYREISRE